MAKKHPENPSQTPEQQPQTPAPDSTGSASSLRYDADAPTLVSNREIQAEAPALEELHIEGYKLIKEIHRGGQGVVYQAVQLGTKRRVALKVLLEGPFAGEATLRRFEREIELAASLRHASIVTILDSGTSHGRYYCAMEYIAGTRLDRYLAEQRPPLVDVLQLFERICDAVNFAHQRGVIHRDLKPSNILVDAEGQPHVLDFGLAKPLREIDDEHTTAAVLSMTGQLLGTVGYMSPEQARGSQDVDVRSDVYSLGVVFYEALLGEAPYDVTGPLGEVLQRIADDEPLRPRTVRSRSRFGRLINDELETILLKALEKDPGRRYQTAGELGRDLHHLLHGEPIEAKRASTLYMVRKTLRRYRVQAAAVGVVLLMMVAFLIVLAFSYTAERRARQEAETLRAEAGRRELRERQARREAEESTEQALAAKTELEQALIRQRIQAGDLARARGALIEARDAYWDAFEPKSSPAARWALRQYYMQTGDRGERLLFFESHGVKALSDDGRLIATSEAPGSISVRDVRTGRLTQWVRAPGTPHAIHVHPDGHLAAAGDGWARLWAYGMLTPTLHVSFAPDTVIQTVFATDSGRGMLVIGSGEVHAYQSGASRPLDNLVLGGRQSGPAAYSRVHRRLAVPTTQGVELVTLAADGRLGSRMIGPFDTPAPTAVCFTGDDLLGVLAGGLYFAALLDDGVTEWNQFIEPSESVEYFDARQGVGAIALGTRDGQVWLYHGDAPAAAWRITRGHVDVLQLAADGESVLTVDDRGSLTRWAPSSERQHTTRLTDQPTVAWSVADDASAVLTADRAGNVSLYASAENAGGGEMIPISRLGWFVNLTGQSWDDVSLATAGTGNRLITRDGTTLTLRNRSTEQRSVVRWGHPFVPVLNGVSLSRDGSSLALHAQSTAGDQQWVLLGPWDSVAADDAQTMIQAELPPAYRAYGFVGSFIREMRFIPGTTRLLVARSNGDLVVLDGDRVESAGGSDSSGALPPPAPWVTLDSPPLTMAFNPAGTRLAVACEDEVVRVYSLENARLLNRVRVGEPIASLAFDDSANVLLTLFESRVVVLYDVRNGERIGRLAFADEMQPQALAWLNDETILLAGEEGIYAYQYADTDRTIAANRVYAHQRQIAQALMDDEFGRAWAISGRLAEEDAGLGRAARGSLVEAVLRRARGPVPQAWLNEVLNGAPAYTLLRLAHAAYDGERFESARAWLSRAAELTGGELDVLSLLRLAQCEYLSEQYASAADRLYQILQHPNFDARHTPLVELQEAAALVLDGRLEDARSVVQRMRNPDRAHVEADFVSTASARVIGRFLVGIGGDNLMAAGFDGILAAVAEQSLDYRDDQHFFAAEIARSRGEREEALRQYQRCIDVARDTWPANWARHRLRQMSQENA